MQQRNILQITNNTIIPTNITPFTIISLVFSVFKIFIKGSTIKTIYTNNATPIPTILLKLNETENALSAIATTTIKAISKNKQ